MTKNIWNPKDKNGKLPIQGVTNRLERGEFMKQYLCEPTQEDKEVYERAFAARLAYERRCAWKYDRTNRSSLPVKKGDRMEDFAVKYGTTVKEMKDCEMAVERAMANGL